MDDQQFKTAYHNRDALDAFAKKLAEEVEAFLLDKIRENTDLRPREISLLARRVHLGAHTSKTCEEFERFVAEILLIMYARGRMDAENHIQAMWSLPIKE